MGKTTETTPCCPESFAAAPGWDAVTGLGSPNFQVISNLVLNNATSFAAIGAYPIPMTTANVNYITNQYNVTNNTVIDHYQTIGGDDDDQVLSDQSLAALVVASIALVGVIAQAVFLCYYVIPSKIAEPLLKI